MRIDLHNHRGENPNNVLSAIWRPRKASDVFQSKSKGQRTKGADGVSPRIQRSKHQELWLPRAKEYECLSAAEDLIHHSFTILFYPDPQQIGQCQHTLVKVELGSVCWFKC
jgi:hypothetical protein